MKIEKNVTSILREMLADPEKDWSNHIPFVRLTEGDFEKARTLIKKYCQNANRRDEVMERLELYKERYETNDFPRPEHLKDFVWWLDDKLRHRKQWETQKQISKEIREVFNTEKYYELETIFEPFEDWFDDIKWGQTYLRRAEGKQCELLESLDSREARISEFLVEGE